MKILLRNSKREDKLRTTPVIYRVKNYVRVTAQCLERCEKLIFQIVSEK